ncbi:hypothetical protein MLD38_009720 [Melastoma candidum]|uniref:Uncharacterized protein n=1 Tax=Melastoma candidum TaxID=119954 RepID=A0ACB9RZR5_9MYRT|nr:hypothetical protein MLD38_009720 [Melastoma candidum]
MPLLTGSLPSSPESFAFEPEVVTSFGTIVLAEGCDHSRSIYWVHAWTVEGGTITQLREYFNTSLTVTRVGGEGSDPNKSASEISKGHRGAPLWESSLSGRAGMSVPGLVLAI